MSDEQKFDDSGVSRRRVLSGVALAGLATVAVSREAKAACPLGTVGLRASFYRIEQPPTGPIEYEGVATIAFGHGSSTFHLSGVKYRQSGVIQAHGTPLSGPQLGELDLVLDTVGGLLTYNDNYNVDLEISVGIQAKNGTNAELDIIEITGQTNGYHHPKFEGPVDLVYLMDGCNDPNVQF